MIHQETEFLDKHLTSSTTTIYSSISPSACDCVQLCCRSRSLSVWCPGNYSPHLLPRGPKATRKSKYPTYSLLGVTFPAGLDYNSFPAAANAVRQSHRRFGSEPWVEILFPYTWPMLHLLAIFKQQILPFYSLLLFVKKQLLPKSIFSSITNREPFFNYSKWIFILLDQILLLLLSRASSSYVTVFGLNMETLNFSITTFKALHHTQDILSLLSSPLPFTSKNNILNRRSPVVQEQAYLM